MLSVVIVGAGPVGLTLGAQLLRYGIPFRIFDRNSGPTDLSKALVLWRRTLQSLHSSVPRDEFAAKGCATVATEAFLAKTEKPTVSLQIKSEDNNPGQFPVGYLIPQSATESILVGQLDCHNVKVERNMEVVKLDNSDPNSCTLTFKNTETGEEEDVQCAYVAACDGGKSPMRHFLSLPFKGVTTDARWLLADIAPDQPVEKDKVKIFMFAGPCFLFPVGSERLRIVAPIGDAPTEQVTTEDTHPITEEDVQKVIDERTVTGIKIRKSYWLAEFRINERQIEKYNHGRVLFAGDAAHVHSPAGGQGMNTGIQDAINLAWKLAVTIKNNLNPDCPLLNTYTAERHPVAAAVIAGASGATKQTQLASNSWVTKVRNFVATWLMALPAAQRAIVHRLCEDNITYRKGPLGYPGMTTILDTYFRAGDPLPDLTWTTSAGSSINSYDFLKNAKGAILFIIGRNDTNLSHGTVPTSFGPLALDVHVLNESLDPKKQFAKKFGLQHTGGFVLVRPDSHIARVADDVDVVSGWMDILQKDA